jgi:hypothetical protein
MKISVVTPSIRKDGINIVAQSLAKQSFHDFEWLVGSPFSPSIPEKYLDNMSGFEWVEDDFTGGFWSLNRIYNRLFQKVSGDLIVTWQDWIWTPPDGLQRFVDAFESLGSEWEKSVVSGVGDQYEKLGQYGKPEIKIWSDPRKTLEHGSFYECNPNDTEWNWCAFSKKAIFDVGGMDEELDMLGYGGDQLQVGERLDALKYKFYLDQNNESFTIRHDRSDFGGQEEWDKKHVIFNGKYDERKRQLVTSGQWPRLNYLKQFDTN